jgi:tetratricopeptide (TPR) repeat protein
MTRGRFELGLGAALLAAVVVHFSALQAPFFADDWLFLDQVRQKSLWAVLASPDPIGNFFRPLGRQLWFWLLAGVGRESPWLFHAANLLLLLAVLVLLARLTRRLVSPVAGVIAAAFLAIHYAVDVPVHWASGSQELLALALGLTALTAYVAGRRWLAAATFLLALLSKESSVVLPVVAVALDSSKRTLPARMKAAWPLALAALVWLAMALWATLRRGTLGAGLSLAWDAVLAVPVQLLRVIAGIEWPTSGRGWSLFGDPGEAALLATALVLLGVSLARSPGAATPAHDARGRNPTGARTTRRGPAPTSVPPPRAALGDQAGTAGARATDPLAFGRALRAGLVWALAGATPVLVVAPHWSAYYFLFALAGAGFLLGALLASRPATLALPVLLVLAWGSARARQLEEFATAPSAWSGQSHVNRFYLERGMLVVSRFVHDLRRLAPGVAPRTTFYYADLPAFAALQVADGPLVRSVYRDSSLRGYFLSQITRERLARGPRRVFFFDSRSGRIEDRTGEPGVLLNLALGLILHGRLEVADATLTAAEQEQGHEFTRRYLRALLAMDQGDTAGAREELRRMGLGLGADGAAAWRAATRQVEQQDTVAAVSTLRLALRSHALDGRLHGMLSDLLLASERTRDEGRLEAYAARALAPEVGLHWRRLAYVLAGADRQPEALAALAKYAELDPVNAARDRGAQQLRALLERMLPGGDLAQRDLTKEVDR